MRREAYNAQKEHTVVGTYPGFKGMEDIRLRNDKGECIVPDSDRFYRPIPVYENFKMLFRGETPYWMPNNGWFFCDTQEFRPRQGQDCRAHHQCLDGGPLIDYSKVPKLQYGWFDLPLEWEPLSCGATVRPGNPTLVDMNDWKEVIKWPDLNEIDFDEMKTMNEKYLGTDRINQLGIHLGFWERLMCLMDVSNAAIALVDEDQEYALQEFLDKLSDFYCDYITRVSKIGRIDSVMVHDDWGTNNGPFFSLETARKFFVAPIKKVVDTCHSLDIIYEHHCCGKAQALAPAMVECGTDYWFPQSTINDLDQLIADYKNDHLTCAVGNPILPKGSSVDEVRKIAKDFVDKYKDKGVLFCADSSTTRVPGHDHSLFPIFQDAVYEYSRLAYQHLDVPKDMEEMVLRHMAESQI